MIDQYGFGASALAFLIAFVAAGAFTIVFKIVYQVATPYHEKSLIREGNAAAEEPAPAPVAKPVPAVASAAPAPGGEWYASRPAGNYALQILGTRSESSAKAFVSKNGSEYRYFKKLHQGQPLYVVTYGQFSSRAAAQAAIKSLPAAVQAGKPWPRSFASIQQEAVRAR